MNVTFVCTANICRSPMAELLLRQWLDRHGVTGVDVSSVGRLWTDHEPAQGSVRAMRGRGLDLVDHRSRILTPAIARDADVLVTMAREHVGDVLRVAPDASARTYTLKELVQRGERAGPRRPDQALADWLAAVGHGTTVDDDVADPIGGPDPAFVVTAAELDALIDRLGRLLWPQAQ